MKLFFKRIELNLPLSRSIRFRLSRTNLPMPALSWHPFRGFSLNTRHSARVSKTFSGITLGFQNTRFTFKGRWESRLFGINLNLSKSGFSLSQRNMLGTYNFSNPNRSSANLFGVQIRGKKAAPWALLGLLMSHPPDRLAVKRVLGFGEGFISLRHSLYTVYLINLGTIGVWL